MISFPWINLEKRSGHSVISGVVDGCEAFILPHLSQKLAPQSPLVFISSTSRKVSELAENLSFFAPEIPLLILPAWDCLPYDRVSPSSRTLSKRLEALACMASLKSSQHPTIILMSVNTLLQRIPPAEGISAHHLTLKSGNLMGMKALSSWLEESGFQRVSTARDVGEYAVRGGILDLLTPGVEEGVRLDFFGDKLESLRLFDAVSQRTVGSLDELVLHSMSEVSLTEKTIMRFRRCYAESFGAPSLKDPLYAAISAGKRFSGMEHWLPFFYENLETVFDYFPNAPFVFDHLVRDCVRERYTTVLDHYNERCGSEKKLLEKDGVPYHPIPPESLYLSPENIENILQKHCCVTLSPFDVPPTEFCKVFQARSFKGRNFSVERAQSQTNVFDAAASHIKDARSSGRFVLITGWTPGSLDRLSRVLCDHGVEEIKLLENFSQTKKLDKDGIACAVLSLESGFETNSLVVLSEQDILGDRFVRKTKKLRNSVNALTEALSLCVGDIVVHADHGIGRFSGLRTLKIQDASHDCLEICYADDNKLLLPVENIELLSRYGSDSSSVILDRLGGTAWQARKAKLKKCLLQIAGQLIQVAAERSMSSAPVITPSETAYQEFVAGFPHEETEDQNSAIDSVLDDLSLGRPMDRLVCGDVGFGKTEVALRAAFVSVMAGFQVAVVVPTTLLSRQHFKNFSQRFLHFPVHVRQLSRLVSASETRLTKKGLSEGTVDIVIGSHALLGSALSFKNLGLLIIDEEQHFGVKQKERLKELKKNIHVLTLSATPIPRTLQRALSGVSELSLIRTAPVDRMVVRSFVAPFDSLLIRETLLREKYRGGQSFYVVPRISDLKDVLDFLKIHVSEVTIGVAHGQMRPDAIENVMGLFCDQHYDVLLSTSIVESGLDIPTANTMIVHRSDVFGLSQLYQLRGRVGRSMVRGYALFLLPEKMKPTESSLQRLKVLQSLDTLGAGFQLATHDMDMRGSGNILGEQQSGHIKEVGFELYQQMLEEAVIEMKESGQNFDSGWSPQITTAVTVMIPDDYVADLPLRLGLYRRIGDLQSLDEIETFAAELMDRFGSLPGEVRSLLEIVSIKNLCRESNISKLDIGAKGAVVSFRKGEFSNPQGLIEYIIQQGAQAKIRPDQSILFLRDWSDPKKQLSCAFQLIKKLAEISAC